MAFGGFNQEATPSPMSEINMTPLVDVMLVLLIIFIITAPLLTHTVPVNLPVTGSVAQPEKPETVTLALNKDGQLFWNDKLLSQAELDSRLQSAAQQKPQPELQLRADKDTRYERIAQIMTSAQKAGLSKLGFVSIPQH